MEKKEIHYTVDLQYPDGETACIELAVFAEGLKEARELVKTYPHFKGVYQRNYIRPIREEDRALVLRGTRWLSRRPW